MSIVELWITITKTPPPPKNFTTKYHKREAGKQKILRETEQGFKGLESKANIARKM